MNADQGVYLEWIDSAGPDGWVDPGEAPRDLEGCKVQTMGLLIDENDDVLVVAACRASQGCVHSPVTIPKVAVTARSRVRLESTA